jgi:hypothetical protein
MARTPTSAASVYAESQQPLGLLHLLPGPWRRNLSSPSISASSPVAFVDREELPPKFGQPRWAGLTPLVRYPPIITFVKTSAATFSPMPWMASNTPRNLPSSSSSEVVSILA